MKKNIIFLFLFFCFTTMNTIAQNTFKFTSKPANEGCEMKGQQFEIKGKLVAEDQYADKQKCLFFANKEEEYILVTSVLLNDLQEATDITYRYFTKEYLADVEFGNFGGELELSIDNMYSKYKHEELSQFNVKKKNEEMNGTTVRNFKNKKELEAFKKMLKQ